MGLNQVNLIGNLGQDPEVRFAASGTAVCNMRVAVNERRKQGETWGEHTEWLTVVTFGKTAENVGQYLAKGRQVFISGRIQTREYETKEGEQRKATEIVAHNVVFLQGGNGAPPERTGRKTNRPFSAEANSDPVEDVLPF